VWGLRQGTTPKALGVAVDDGWPSRHSLWKQIRWDKCADRFSKKPWNCSAR